jgi:hypothetical protein
MCRSPCSRGRRWVLPFQSMNGCAVHSRRAQDLLNPSDLKHEGLLTPAPIAKQWDEHQSGARNARDFLWNVLMFEAWNAVKRSSQSAGGSRASA